MKHFNNRKSAARTAGFVAGETFRHPVSNASVGRVPPVANLALKRSVRLGAMLGTALGGGILALTLLGAQPAMAGVCTFSGSGAGLTDTCTGGFHGGIVFVTPVDLTIAAQSATIGNPGGPGIGLFASAPAATFLGVTTDANTTIGATAAYAVSGNGIQVSTPYANSTIAINSAAQIGSAATPVGGVGIFGEILSAGAPNAGLVTITNSGPITANNDGIFALTDLIGTGVEDPAVVITNSGTIVSKAVAIFGEAYGNGGYNGNASSVTTIANTGALTSTGTGLYGASVANTFGPKALSYAGVSVSNKGAITSANGSGEIGTARGAAAGRTSYNAVGGLATSGTAVYNSGAVTSSGAGVGGFARSYSGAVGSYNIHGSGVAGVAVAGVTIKNVGPVTSKTGIGVDGYSLATAVGRGYTAAGGAANAATTVTNSGAITSFNIGVYGGARAYSGGHASYNAKGVAVGGTSVAGVTITNSGAVSNAHGFGVEGFTLAEAGAHGYAATGGKATTTTTITNSGALTSPYGGIFGYASADTGATGSVAAGAVNSKATGGTSAATATIANSGAITTSKSIGIEGLSITHAGATGYTAVGGATTSYTHITNSGAINSRLTGIYGIARSYSNSLGSTTAPKSVATGGTAASTVVISNTGSVYNKYANSIDGISRSYAAGTAYTANGGKATSTTTIYNSGALTSLRGVAIYGGAVSGANATGSYALKGSKATGGTAASTVTITNVGTVAAGYAAAGVVGNSRSYSIGRAYTGKGGTATATVTIVNSGKVQSYHRDAIDGFALTNASGFGNTAANKGSGSGGKATSSITITNSGPLTALNGNGISALSEAFANGSGYTGTGGAAYATTTITNSGTIRSDAGIYGAARAYANGFGSSKVEPGHGTGGTSVATVTITNSGTITASGPSGVGIDGISLAEAYGRGHIAVGGTATAATTITNSGRILSTYDGIIGAATAFAGGYGSYNILGAAKGGTASASVTITNSGTVTSQRAIGIYGASLAVADGLGNNGAGGTATANTTVVNSGRVTTTLNYADGVFAGSRAVADGTYAGGAASATTYVANSGLTSIHTTGNVAPGIVASSYAGANGGYLAGVATATTKVNNTGTITTTGVYSSGISAGSVAYARGYTNAALANSGTATANTSVTNSGAIATLGKGSDGVYATALAVGGSYSSGVANGSTNITNSGTIGTAGLGSVGIVARTAAGSGGASTASTTVTNAAAGRIATVGNYSDGILATSLAAGVSGPSSGATTANATTTINNYGTITTRGVFSTAIAGSATAYGYTSGNATIAVKNTGTITTTGYGADGVNVSSAARVDSTANTTVTNTGSITTSGIFAAGVVASSYAFDVVNNATATTTVNNTGGTITTTGLLSPGVAVYANALSVLGTAKATVVVNNTGTIHTYGVASNAITAGVFFGSPTSTITVNNSATGTIIASGSPYTAVSSFGAPTTINNSGYIRGNVQLTSFNDTFNNSASGTWVLQGNSNFGAGTDTVNNSGVVTMVEAGSTLVPSTDVATAGHIFDTVTLSGLENFNNTGGLVSMVNGSPNDRIVLPGNFNGTGNSRLAVDAFLGGPGSTADVLQVGLMSGQGNVTGVTAVQVNDVNLGFGAYNPVGIPIAESGGTPGATATTNVSGNFTMPTIVKGLWDYNLFYVPKNAAGDPCMTGFNCWFLASRPGQDLSNLPRLLTAANSVWEQAAGSWADRTADLRNYYLNPVPTAATPLCDPNSTAKVPCLPAATASGGPASGVWFRGFGDWSRNTATSNFTQFGQTFGTNVSYQQNTGGVQLGADFAANTTGYQTILLGVLGGAVDSRVNFNSGATADMRGGNIGGYATYLNRDFFVDALGLANFMSLNYQSQNVGGFGGLSGQVDSYGGHIDTGYRFLFSQNWFLEPIATLEVVHTQFGNLNLPGTTVALDDNDVRGRLGGTIGTIWNSGSFMIEPTFTGGVWHSFTGASVASVTSDGLLLNIADPNPDRSYGEIGGAVNIFQVGSNWSGFVKADYDFGRGYEDGSIKGGVRYQW